MHPSLAPAIDYVEKGYDADLGLVRMGVRDYDAILGRFTTPDPLFLEELKRCADSPVECNLYSYAAGNPLLFVDPSGLAIDFWSREFWQGVAFGTYQAGLPGAILVPSPNPDSPEFEAGRAVGLGATSTTQGVVGTLKLLGGGGLVAGGVAGAEAGGLSLAAVPAGVAMCAEGVGTLSIAGVNGVAAVKAWQHAMAMDARRGGGSGTGWKPDARKDLDWRGTGRGLKEALDEAFERTGVAKSEFKVTKWAKDSAGKSFPVEWRAPGGAEVSIDAAHVRHGPDVPHVGYQMPGKGGLVGHILLDEVPVNR